MAKKAIFKTAAAAILIFKNLNFWSRDYSICYMYRISSKSNDFSLTYAI